jgi:glycosyltransferase involved in cell wall biosynthesis
MILGVLPPQGGGLASLRAAGQDNRFIHSYLERYARYFEKVYYFSYLKEEADLPQNCYLVKNPGLHRWLYAFLLPVVQRRYFQCCDVLRVMQMVGAIPALVAKGLYHIPFAGTYGYNYLENARDLGMELRGQLFELRARLGLRRADKVMVTTPALGEYVNRFTSQERVMVLPNGVDTVLFRPSRSQMESVEIKVISVGRFDPVKNLSLLIDAAAEIRELPIKLVLVGSGDLQQELKERADRRGVSCEFTGILPNEALPEIYRNASVFALTSLHEGHPKALLEAMSCGLPCVGTNVPGIREMIRDGENGLLCDLSTSDLASKIRRLITDRELAVRIGSNARRFIEENYDLEVLLEKETRALVDLACNANPTLRR